MTETYKPKVIRCPICKKKIGKYDGQSSMDLILTCRKCKKKIVYHVETGQIETKQLPQRSTSSGLIFK